MRSRRSGQLLTAYPNQLRALRRLRGLTQEDVARYLGHLDIEHYRDIEAGLHFPRAQILFRLLALFRATILQAYPTLMWRAEDEVKEIGEKRDQKPH
jgi:transcriptional regulator with XRE-family HTH domain